MGAIEGTAVETLWAMTPPQNQQLDHLRSEWAGISRTRQSREAVAVLAASHESVDRLDTRDLGEIVGLLEPRSRLTQVERAHLVATLLASSPDHPLIARALLQTLLPGIVAVARRLQWGAGTGDDPSTFLADLITVLYELIIEWGGQTRPYAAPDLLNAARCRMRRRIEAVDHRSLVGLERADGSELEPSPTFDPDPHDDLEAQIAILCEGDPIAAAGLLGRAVLGYTYREIAEMTGHSPRLLAERSRAVARRILR